MPPSERYALSALPLFRVRFPPREGHTRRSNYMSARITTTARSIVLCLLSIQPERSSPFLCCNYCLLHNLLALSSRTPFFQHHCYITFFLSSMNFTWRAFAAGSTSPSPAARMAPTWRRSASHTASSLCGPPPLLLACPGALPSK